MYNTKAYSATSATSPLASTKIPWRDPNEHHVEIEILFCGICGGRVRVDRHARDNRGTQFSVGREHAMEASRDLAGGSPVTPPAGREDLGKFEPLRRFKNRLDCVLLPLRALRQGAVGSYADIS